MTVRATYDPTVTALYVHLRDDLEPGRDTKEIVPGSVFFDYKDEELVGIEVLLSSDLKVFLPPSDT